MTNSFNQIHKHTKANLLWNVPYLTQLFLPLSENLCITIPTKYISKFMQIQRTVSDLESFKEKQVVAPKGLHISLPTTVVMPNHIGFAQLFSKWSESVAKALWDSNKQDSIFS